MFWRRTFAVSVSVATLLLSATSVAQYRDPRDNRGPDDLQRRVYQLESTVYQLSQRLERLEYGGGGSQGRFWICTVKDTTWGTIYQNKAESRLQAAANATNNCISASMPSACKAEPQCERL